MLAKALDRAELAPHIHDMTISTHRFREGDVILYSPMSRHCREGMALVEKRGVTLVAFDTFWDYNPTALIGADLAMAEVLFNLDDVDTFEPTPDANFEDYDPCDRFVITHQHGLQQERFIRKSAQPSLDQKVVNAGEALLEAEHALRSAHRRAEQARADYDALIAQQKEQSCV